MTEIDAYRRELAELVDDALDRVDRSDVSHLLAEQLDRVRAGADNRALAEFGGQS